MKILSDNTISKVEHEAAILALEAAATAAQVAHSKRFQELEAKISSMHFKIGYAFGAGVLVSLLLKFIF